MSVKYEIMPSIPIPTKFGESVHRNQTIMRGYLPY